MKIVLFAFFMTAGLSSFAQRYYQDITSTIELNNRMKALTAAKVRAVMATGYDANGVKTADFSETQTLPDDRTLKIASRNERTISTVYYRFDANGRLIQVCDTSGSVQSTTDYNYDAQGRLLSVKSAINDTLQDFTSTEDHLWQYATGQNPVKMWRIVNGRDSSEFRMVNDENGNVGEEHEYRRGREVDFIYYYYNGGRLTDVVRYNKTFKSLIPDFILQYDEKGNIVQKVTPVSYYNPNYLIWRYGFNEKGLKTQEVLFDKHKQRTGTITYQYSFGE